MNGFAHASRPRESVAGFGVGSGGVSRSRGKGSNCDRGLSSVRSRHVNLLRIQQLTGRTTRRVWSEIAWSNTLQWT
jgi:hypothetical protein